MRKRTLIVAVSVALLALAGGGYAIGGGGTGIWDDGHFAKPGKLDDGKALLPQAKISVHRAVVAAEGAESGDLGQVDLERLSGRLVFTVDIGSNEVHVDAANGSIVSVTPRD